MKIIISYIVLILSIESASSQTPALNTTKEFKRMEWLVGTWHRINAKPGRSGVEMWEKISDSELHGSGIVMKGSDTLFVEKMKIVVKENKLFYVADVPENKALVYFALTDISTHSFTCENSEHDFPKKIHYEVQGSTLTATISGNGKSIEYLFEKK